MEEYKLLPYGVSQFERVIRDNHYLVDKTRFIPMLENQAPYLFLIRVKWQEGVDQADKYFNCRRAKELSQGTELHRIVMLFRSRTLERMEELQ